MFPLPPTISENSEELAMIGNQRKHRMRERVMVVKDLYTTAQHNLRLLYMKAESFLHIELNPLTQQDKFCSCLMKLDVIALFLEDFNALYRNFIVTNSLNDSAQDLSITQSTPEFISRPMLEAPPNAPQPTSSPIPSSCSNSYSPRDYIVNTPSPRFDFTMPPPISKHNPGSNALANVAPTFTVPPQCAPFRPTAPEFVPRQPYPVQPNAVQPHFLQGPSLQAVSLRGVPLQAYPIPPSCPQPLEGAPLQAMPVQVKRPIQIQHPMQVQPYQPPAAKPLEPLLQPMQVHHSQQQKTVHRHTRQKKQNSNLVDLSSSSHSLLDVSTEPTSSARRTEVTPTARMNGHQPPRHRTTHSASSDTDKEQPRTKRNTEAFAPFKVDEDDPTVSSLPSQEMLELDKEYESSISYGGSPSHFYVITDPLDQISFGLSRLNAAMMEYYTEHRVDVRPLLGQMQYCAIIQANEWFRCLIVEPVGEDELEVYFVDYGGIETVSLEQVQPLVPRFCDKAPYARKCHLTGVEPASGEAWSEEAKNIINELHFSIVLTLVVDDNSSESFGVTLKVPDSNITINQMLLDKGLAISNTPLLPITPSSTGPAERVTSQNSCPRAIVKTGRPLKKSKSSELNAQMKRMPSVRNLSTGSPVAASVLTTPSPEPHGAFNPSGTSEAARPDLWDINDCPEYTDPLMAVQGYSNRDEADICKFYTGPPNTTCFKGSNCKKKHIVIHPDGWTLDQVEVSPVPEPLSLPEEGARLRIYVCHVQCHNLFYVHLPNLVKDSSSPTELLPKDLSSLIKRMNADTVRQSLTPLQGLPATGELLATFFVDNRLYRALVIDVDFANERVQVRYIDFGNCAWVKLSQIRTLDPEFCTLPFQAVPCLLADVTLKPDADISQAAAALRTLILEKPLIANVLSILSSNTLLLELEDADGFSVAETLVLQHPRLFLHRPSSRSSSAPSQAKVINLPG